MAEMPYASPLLNSASRLLRERGGPDGPGRLRNERPLRRPHLPTPVTLDERVGEPNAAVEGLALFVAPANTNDARHDRGVAVDARAHLGQLERFEDGLIGLHRRDRLALRLERTVAR